MLSVELFIRVFEIYIIHYQQKSETNEKHNNHLFKLVNIIVDGGNNGPNRVYTKISEFNSKHHA